MRENGYYWVKTFGEWTVSEWKDGYWWFCGNDCEYREYEIGNIGEKVERKENSVTLRNIPRLGGKVSVVLLDTETGKEETLMIGAIVDLEATEDGAKKITVRMADTAS